MAQWIDLELARGPVRIEYAWLDAAPADAPVMVFLHEGLGSLAMWRDYPAQLCAAARCRGLVYSRPGYGQSQPLPHPWGADFMHVQAYEVLPALLTALGLAPLEISARTPQDAGAGPAPASAPLILFGHSDGASIALLFAARYPAWPAAVVAVAPHLFVEDKTLSAIAALQAPLLQQPLLARLARHHRHPATVFTAWSQVWLAPEFAAWSIADTIATLRCPVLGVQGVDDEYGTMHQIHALRDLAGPTRLLDLADCGHSPHRDQPDALTTGVCDFLTFLQGD